MNLSELTVEKVKERRYAGYRAKEDPEEWTVYDGKKFIEPGQRIAIALREGPLGATVVGFPSKETPNVVEILYDNAVLTRTYNLALMTAFTLIH
jgi:hypothetical protein